jgi:hypothetical protein
MVISEYTTEDGIKYKLERDEEETIIWCHLTGVAIPNKIIDSMIRQLEEAKSNHQNKF